MRRSAFVSELTMPSFLSGQGLTTVTRQAILLKTIIKLKNLA